VAVARDDVIITNWLAAKKKVDCPTTCGATPLKVPMISGLDHKDRKPISICTTRKDRKGEWFVGYNLWQEKTCVVSIDGEEYRGDRYYCLCSTHGIQHLR